jgi:hypothetical protein
MVITVESGIDLKFQVQIIDFDKPDTLTSSWWLCYGTPCGKEALEVDYEYHKTI